MNDNYDNENDNNASLNGRVFVGGAGQGSIAHLLAGAGLPAEPPHCPPVPTAAVDHCVLGCARLWAALCAELHSSLLASLCAAHCAATVYKQRRSRPAQVSVSSSESLSLSVCLSFSVCVSLFLLVCLCAGGVLAGGLRPQHRADHRVLPQVHPLSRPGGPVEQVANPRLDAPGCPFLFQLTQYFL